MKKNSPFKMILLLLNKIFAAGVIRMGILLRIHYLLETDPTVALEECMISTPIAIAKNSPTCANAIIKCERLVHTLIGRFAEKDKIGVYPFKIKSVTLLKVLAQSDQKNCIEFIKSGIFQDASSNLCQCPLSLDQWMKSGKENCKHASASMVEQLRFWKKHTSFWSLWLEDFQIVVHRSIYQSLWMMTKRSGLRAIRVL